MKKKWVYVFIFAIAVVVIIFVSSVNLDLNHDGVVNITDLQILAAHFEGKAAYNSSYDFNNDSRIDLFDVVKVARDINVSSEGNKSGNVTPYFSDGFESGDLSYTENGFTWTSSAYTSVVDTAARTGNHSLQFWFGGDGTANSPDSWAEQRFDMGSLHSDVWLDYWLYIPSNYYHRNYSDGVNNNKWLCMWDNGSYHGGGTGYLQFFLETEPIGNGDSSLELHYSTPSQGDNIVSNIVPDFITNAERGRWNHVQVYVHAASSATSGDGLLQMLWNGKEVINWTGVPGGLYQSGAPNQFQKGYLMGWANSGFTNDTDFYLDDFKVYTQNPGWNLTG